MATEKMGEMFSFTDKLNKKQEEEAKEYSNLGPVLMIDYIINNYFKGGRGQDRLMLALESKIENIEEREKILEFINSISTSGSYDAEENELEEIAAEELDEDFDLVNTLCEAASKTKEEIDKELSMLMAKKARQTASLVAQLRNKSATVHKLDK